MLKKIVVLLIVGSTLLIACESQGNNSRSTTAVTPETENFTRVVPDHEDRKIVSFAVNESEIRTYATLIELFESENPNIKVHLVPLTKIFDDAANGDGIGSQTLALAQAVDVFPSTYAFGTHWKQLTQDLTPFIANTPQFDQGDFYLDSLYEQDGSIRVLPISLSFSLRLLMDSKDQSQVEKIKIHFSIDQNPRMVFQC